VRQGGCLERDEPRAVVEPGHREIELRQAARMDPRRVPEAGRRIAAAVELAAGTDQDSEGTERGGPGGRTPTGSGDREGERGGQGCPRSRERQSPDEWNC